MSAERKQQVRAFISIHLPAEVRERLRAVQTQLAVPASAVRWTAFEQLHLTLEFLGNVAIQNVPELEAALKKVATAHSRLALSVEEVGAFSSLRNPRIIWAGIKGDVESLLALQAGVGGAVSPWVAEQEMRPYRPHVTLGRVRPINRRDLRKVSDALESVTDRTFGSWSVEEFALMQSKLSPHGSQHSTLATFRLGG